MSRTGKLPVTVPASVNVTVAPDKITVKGKQGELSAPLTSDVVVSFGEGKISVQPANDTKRARAMWGTVRSIISGMVQGVDQGFIKKMEIQGVGYRAAVNGNILALSLGYSHEIRYVIPQGIKIVAPKPTSLEISGADKQRVGQVAAEIRQLRKPEPYKGKGVRYEDERVRRKEGKKK
jgi:large subunit ribosomal protein L6